MFSISETNIVQIWTVGVQIGKIYYPHLHNLITKMSESEIFKNIRKALLMDQVSFGTLFGKGSSWTTKLENGYNECFRQFVEVARILIEKHNVSATYILTGKGSILNQSELSKVDALSSLEGTPSSSTGSFVANTAIIFKEKIKKSIYIAV